LQGRDLRTVLVERALLGTLARSQLLHLSGLHFSFKLGGLGLGVGQNQAEQRRECGPKDGIVGQSLHHGAAPFKHSASTVRLTVPRPSTLSAVTSQPTVPE
jgi:hypothetical protein